MDSPGYRLAITDRAFAFDGAYRSPTSLSVADRAAYGLSDSANRNRAGGFSIALHAAANVGHASKVHSGNRYLPHLGERCSPYYRDRLSATNADRRLPIESPKNVGLTSIVGLGKRCLPNYKAGPASPRFSTVRAAIGDAVVSVVALRGRVFIGVHNKCLIPK
jgi:hypothetical protein